MLNSVIDYGPDIVIVSKCHFKLTYRSNTVILNWFDCKKRGFFIEHLPKESASKEDFCHLVVLRTFCHSVTFFLYPSNKAILKDWPIPHIFVAFLDPLKGRILITGRSLKVFTKWHGIIIEIGSTKPHFPSRFNYACACII